jgi:hypothetical protein
MAKNNDVYTIIPFQNDNDLMDAGFPKSALTVGQVGIFDYDTGLSIDAAGAGSVRKFFIAMAVDTTGGSVVNDYVESAGTHIQKGLVSSYNVRCYTPGQSQIIDVQNFTASCDTQYALKVELNNDQKYMNYGYNQLTKTFVVKTGCCEGCEGCPSGDCAELVSLLIAEINADEDALIVASAVANIGSIKFVAGAPTVAGDFTVQVGTDLPVTVTVAGGDTAVEIAAKAAAALTANSKYTATSDGVDTVSIVLADGAAVTVAQAITFVAGATAVTAPALEIVDVISTAIADVAAFAVANPGACPTLRLTSVTESIKQYCDVNTMYYHVRNTTLTVSFAQANTTSLGFDCNGTIVTVQDNVISEGMGYDMANIEYKAGGFTGKPSVYRTGTMLGVAFQGFSSLVDKAGIYNKIDITYDLESNSGWLDYKNNLNTSIVIPCGNDNAAADFADVMDALLADFDPKADDLVACDCNLNLTEDKSGAEDGLG